MNGTTNTRTWVVVCKIRADDHSTRDGGAEDNGPGTGKDLVDVDEVRVAPAFLQDVSAGHGECERLADDQ